MDNYNNTTTETSNTMVEEHSPKSKLAAALLCFFLGGLGIHRFYLGKVGTGILLLLLTVIGGFTTFIFIGYFFLAIAVIWEIIDFLKIIFGSMRDGSGKKVM